LFDLDEEIISSEFNPIHNEDPESTLKNDRFKPYLLESFLNHDTLMSSPLKIDSLLVEFAGALIFLKSIPPGIDEANCGPEEDIHLVERLFESYHFDIPSPYRPPAKPPDGNTGTLNIKMMGDVSDQKVPIPNLMITRILNQEKSPDLSSHQGLEAFQPSAECPMIINGKNIPLLDVPLFHFYPP
nr:hypothetical protein [Tanacetum cinerariifolium]